MSFIDLGELYKSYNGNNFLVKEIIVKPKGGCYKNTFTDLSIGLLLKELQRLL